MIRLLQVNVDGRRAAHNLLEATAAEAGSNVLIVSEPYRSKPEAEGWFGDLGNRAAVAIANPRIQIVEAGPADNRGFRWVQLEGVRVYACYWSPNTAFAEFEDFLGRLDASVRGSVWGGNREDRKVGTGRLDGESKSVSSEPRR